MKKFIKTSLLTAILSTVVSSASFAKDLAPMGKELTIKNKTNISEIMKAPDSFVGKKVLIQGKVLDVCTERGCWMKVSSDKKKESMLIKVKDGEMVFPIAARGKEVTIEGELFKIEKHNHDKETEEMSKEKGTDIKKSGKTIYMFKPKGVKFGN